MQASIGATDAGLGGGPVTADIAIDPVPDAPAVTPATTREDTQTTSGLVITRNALDGPEITHFQILDIFNGTLFHHDGVTAILAERRHHRGAGRRRACGSRRRRTIVGSATFLVIGVFDARVTTATALQAIAGGIITVTAVADTPSITNATTPVNAQTTSGLVVRRNPADGNQVTHVKVTGITGGTALPERRHDADRQRGRSSRSPGRGRAALHADDRFRNDRPRHDSGLESARPMPASAARRSRPTSPSTRCRPRRRWRHPRRRPIRVRR